MSDWDVVVSIFEIFAFGSAGYCAGLIVKLIVQRISPKTTGLEYFSGLFLVLGSHYGLMNLVIDLEFAGLLPSWLSMLLWAEIYIVGGAAASLTAMWLIIVPIFAVFGVAIVGTVKTLERFPLSVQFLQYASTNRHISIPIICLIAVMMLYFFR